MFGKQIRLKSFLGGIVVTAAVAVVAVPAAFSSTSSRGGTEAATQVQPNRFTSDTLASNDEPPAPTLTYNPNPNGYVPATVIPDAAPAVTASTGSTGGSGFHWGDAGVGAGIVVGLALLILLGGMLLRTDRRGVSTA